jgi:uncharacterized protein with GYD domain
MNDLKAQIRTIQDKKDDIRKLSNEVREMEYSLIKLLANNGEYDCLSINYSRLRRIS